MRRAVDVGYTLHDIRKYTLWGNLMAGGAGVEYYFGYGLADNDLVAENFRSRDKSWDYGRIAIDFFHSQKIPFWEMTNVDELVGNDKHDNSRYASRRRTKCIWCILRPEARRRSTCRRQAASSRWSGSIHVMAVP